MWFKFFYHLVYMKRTLSLLSVVLFVAALIMGVITYRDEEKEAGLVKVLRDPERVDQRWVYVSALASASLCFALWAMFEKRK